MWVSRKQKEQMREKREEGKNKSHPDRRICCDEVARPQTHSYFMLLKELGLSGGVLSVIKHKKND